MKSKLTQYFRFIQIVAGCLLFQSVAHAGIVALDSTNAAGWTIENYTDSGGFIVLWNTGAVCNGVAGPLYMPANPPQAEIGRLWALITTSKVSNAPIFIRYDNTNCLIQSFGLK